MALAVLGLVYFIAVEMRWFMAQLSIDPIRALVAALLGLAQGFLFLLLVGFLFTR